MAVHKPFDREFFTIGGSVMKEGFSLNLAKGQFGIFNTNVQTSKGSKAVSSFEGLSKKNTLLEFKTGDRQKSSRTTSGKTRSSFPFHISDVIDVEVSAPKTSEIKVDDIVIGYDGIDPTTSLQLKQGEHKEISIEIEGKMLEYMGVPDGIANFTVPLDAYPKNGACLPDVDYCEDVDMLPIIDYAIEYIKNLEFRGGVKLTEAIEVTPVIKLASIKRTGEFKQAKFELKVSDTGDSNTLALVQQQYPNVKVEVKDRVGTVSTYEVTIDQVGETAPVAPADYVQTIGSVIKGCEECPEGYTEVKGGFVYSILLTDDGVDKSSAIEAAEGGIAGAVAGTALKGAGQDGDVGMYTVVLTEKLTEANLKTFVTANPTATVDFVGEVSAICSNDNKSTIKWTAGGVVTFSSEEYKIVLPDTECGESRLGELQAFYPELTISETGVTGGCQREYKTTVPTNTIGEECDPIYQDTFKSEGPQNFDGVAWIPSAVAVDGKEGLYGIRLRGKVFKLYAGEDLRDQIAYVEDSVRIKAAGGYPTDYFWSTTNGNIVDNPFKVSVLSTYQPRTHVAGNLLDFEKRANTFFTGRLLDYDYLGRILTGNESNLVNLDAQLVDYAVTIKRSIFSQGLSQKHEEYITYHIYAEVGRHQGVEDLVNALAAANGIEGVKAFPTV